MWGSALPVRRVGGELKPPVTATGIPGELNSCGGDAGVECLDQTVPLFHLRKRFGPKFIRPHLAEVIRRSLLLLDPGEVLEVVELLAILVVELAEVVGGDSRDVARLVPSCVDLLQRAVLLALLDEA